jgi:hypothetical protein
MNSPRKRPLLAVLCLLAALPLVAAEPWTQTLAQQALGSGFLQKLPVPVSKAFGLAKPDEGSDVRQLLTKDGHRIRTFNVSVANHNDLIIFNIDAKAGANLAYLVSPDGSLRKAIAYQSGDSSTRELSAADGRAGLAREQKFWVAKAKRSQPKQ